MSVPNHLEPGVHVIVGPAYRMGGALVPDGSEGPYTVLRVRSTIDRDCDLVRGHVRTLSEYREIDPSDYDTTICARRLTIVGIVQDDSAREQAPWIDWTSDGDPSE